ncbi:MAG: nucleotidyltransferase, partial [Bacteroidales bacterium]|nr:nucleotidyltransferase [Bacteroidales bacterium]
NANEPKKEFYIPYVVNDAIIKGKCSVKVLTTPSKWFGVTFQEDRPVVVEKLKNMIEAGVYPSPLF